MLDFVAGLFRSDFLPHGVCYRWSPGVVWLHVVSDLLIALAYYFIPFALIYIVRSRRDLVFPWMFWLFGIFILACGTTHLMSVWVVWYPVYRLDGVVKLITALASVPTAILLMRLAPAVIALPSPEQLRRANADLQREVSERIEVEAKMRDLNLALEARVAERTRDLEIANRHLRESEMRLQTILDSAPPLIYVKDPEGRYDFVNRRFEQTFRTTREQVKGQSDYDLFPAAQAETYREADRRVLETGAPVEVEEFTYGGGNKQTYISVKFPLFDASGKPYAMCGISTDITDRKIAEEAMQRYNAELEQFAFIAAHDLQEPLRTVKSYSQWLAKQHAGSLSSEARELLDFIVGGVERMSLLVNDLQSYTEVANRQAPRRVSCDLNSVVRDTVRNLDASISASRAAVTADDLPTVTANPRRMVQLLQNLVANAIKYRSAADPRIHIGVKLLSHEWVISVKDNGMGFDQKYAAQIFGVFKRLHGREIPGTGVGLAICKQIVEQHGGRIWADSAAEEGATFSFTLPV